MNVERSKGGGVRDMNLEKNYSAMLLREVLAEAEQLIDEMKQDFTLNNKVKSLKEAKGMTEKEMSMRRLLAEAEELIDILESNQNTCLMAEDREYFKNRIQSWKEAKDNI